MAQKGSNIVHLAFKKGLWGEDVGQAVGRQDETQIANRKHCVGGKGPFRAFKNAHSLTGIPHFQGFLSSLIKFDKFGVSTPVSRAMHREKFDYLSAPYNLKN